MSSGCKSLLVVVGIVFLVLCCSLPVCLAIGAIAVNQYGLFSTEAPVVDGNPSYGLYITPAVPDPYATAETPSLPPVFSLPVDDLAHEMLRLLRSIEVPINDPRDLSARLNGIRGIPLTVDTPPLFQVGDKKDFWVTNVDTNVNFQITAGLQYVTENAYFWIQDGVDFDSRELRNLAVTFNDKIYPTNRNFFGSEWTPGIDNDPRLYILFARGLGSNLAGYFSSADSIHPLAHKYSNAHEMFLLNADNVWLGSDFTYGVLAHEFQHMIHWYQDRNEESWLNEGFSELAAFLNGYDPGGFDYLYISNPDLQLNDWPDDPNATTPHYGASFLFVTYFLDRFGEEATQALVAHDENGLESIDRVMTELGLNDPISGQSLGADDVFADWTLANLLGDESIADGRYAYSIYPSAPQANVTEWVTNCPMDWRESTVRQYGVDYIRLMCSEPWTLTFSGSTEVSIVPEDPRSGQYTFWSNKGDESNMTLTRTFDFSAVSGSLTFSYWTWYDLEKDYDYLYLVVSENGEDWTILTTPSGTDQDLSGNSYGWGYNGQSGGWIQEMVDLSQYAGRSIQIRFEYVTDAAVNGEGFLLDDLEIEEVGYFEDFESGSGGWEAKGFVYLYNRLPQTFRVSLVKLGEQIEIETVDLDDAQSFRLPLDFGGEYQEVIVAVSGTTRFTRQPAYYRFGLE